MPDSTDIETMDRPTLHAALADYFGVSRDDIEQAFTYRHTEALRSTLQTIWQGRTQERAYMITGAGVTGLAAVTLASPVLCLVFGGAATWGGRALLQRSRLQLEDATRACIQARKERAECVAMGSS